jgi:hypothetical protein
LLDADLHIALSFALTFGVPMALAYAELRRIERRRRGGPGGNAPAKAPEPRLPGGDDALPPLPDSLRRAAEGRVRPARAKVPEPA